MWFLWRIFVTIIHTNKVNDYFTHTPLYKYTVVIHKYYGLMRLYLFTNAFLDILLLLDMNVYLLIYLYFTHIQIVYIVSMRYTFTVSLLNLYPFFLPLLPTIFNLYYVYWKVDSYRIAVYSLIISRYDNFIEIFPSKSWTFVHL